MWCQAGTIEIWKFDSVVCVLTVTEVSLGDLFFDLDSIIEYLALSKPKTQKFLREK